MKKAKIVVVLVIVFVIGFIGWQNAGFVTDQRPFKVLTYESPEIYNGVVILAAFLLGALLVYISGLLARFKARKEIKDLTARIEACQMEKSALQKEKAVAQPPDPGPADPDGAA
ncbi:MAG: lipopolysaccharide assembly protein LapA domain-containing protein [Thermodesulfobacteriota bacterium]|nr:lipopolysaccharide assembly protein LapA domain-containing protein [Thermodesulfobacteriota bacterium]